MFLLIEYRFFATFALMLVAKALESPREYCGPDSNFLSFFFG